MIFFSFYFSLLPDARLLGSAPHPLSRPAAGLPGGEVAGTYGGSAPVTSVLLLRSPRSLLRSPRSLSRSPRSLTPRRGAWRRPPPRHPAALQPPPGRRCPGPSPSGGAVPRQASASSRPRRAHTPSHRSHPFPGARRRSGAGRPESARRRRRQRLPRAASPRRGR